MNIASSGVEMGNLGLGINASFQAYGEYREPRKIALEM
jgi:hypothetical protein